MVIDALKKVLLELVVLVIAQILASLRVRMTSPPPEMLLCHCHRQYFGQTEPALLCYGFLVIHPSAANPRSWGMLGIVPYCWLPGMRPSQLLWVHCVIL